VVLRVHIDLESRVTPSAAARCGKYLLRPTSPLGLVLPSESQVGCAAHGGV
jgi:hypothetical protein